MKANAKKLLALIMAMVMSLSLAAPAMAAGADAAAELVPQATVGVTNTDLIATKIDVDQDGFTLTMSDGSTQGKYLWNKESEWPSEKWAKVTKTTEAVSGAKIGEYGSRTKYVVSQGTNVDSYDFATATDTEKKALKDLTSSPIYKADSKDQITLEKVTMTQLADNQSWYETGKKDTNGKDVYALRQGFLYQEKQDNGKYCYYWKLKSTIEDDKKNKSFDSTSKAVWYYAKSANNGALLATDGTQNDKIRAALKDATILIDPAGNTTGADFTEFYATKNGYPATASLDNATIETTVKSTSYTYTIGTFDDSAFTGVTGGTDAITVSWYQDPTTSTYKRTGTFNVSLTTTATIGGEEKQIVVSDAETVKDALTELAKKSGTIFTTSWRVTDVSATATNGYWTVTAENPAMGEAEATVSDYALSTNTSYYESWTLAGTPTVLYKAGLTNLSSPGSYYATKDDYDANPKKISGIEANTKALGPVIVDPKSLPSDVVWSTTPTDLGLSADGTEKWYVFESVAHLQKALTNKDCGAAKTISYQALVMNATINGKANEAVKTQTITRMDGTSGMIDVVKANTKDWLRMKEQGKNVDVVAGTLTLAKSTDHLTVTEYKEDPSTCKTKGQKVTQVICGRCRKLIASDTKELDLVTEPVAKKSATDYVFTKAEYDASTYKTSQKTPHYIAEVEITTVPATKDKAGSITTKYKCNLGEYHDELTTTKELTKEQLEHSGAWSVIDWGTQNTSDARDPAALYGFTPFVFDTDVDFPEATISGDKDVYFQSGTSVRLTKQPDGTYYGTLAAHATTATPANVAKVEKYVKDATGKKTHSTQYYMATVIVSNIKVAEKECLDGSATATITVYQAADKSYADPDLVNSQNLEESLKQKKVAVVPGATFTKDIVVPANKTHIDANNDGKCDNCSAEINQTTPINENTVDISKATVTFKAMTYTGKVAQPTVTVTLDGVKLAKGVDYEVEEMQDVNAGTYPLVVKGKGDFSGRVVGNVTINKASSSMKIKSAPKSLTSKKKKAVTGQVKMTYTNSKLNKFAVTGKVAGVSIDKKTGKITVKKNIKKKGTFKFKVTGKAKNANYTAPKAVTGKVVIKIGKK